MLGLSSQMRMPSTRDEPTSCLSHSAYSKPCRVLFWQFLAVAEFANPLFQNHQVTWLDTHENNSHVSVSRGISHFAECRECTAFAADSDSQFGSSEKRLTCGNTTAIQANLGHSPLKLKLGLHVHQFHARHKRITACPRTFKTNLDRIVDFVRHIFLFRNVLPNTSVISYLVALTVRGLRALWTAAAPARFRSESPPRLCADSSCATEQTGVRMTVGPNSTSHSTTRPAPFSNAHPVS